MLHIQSWMTVMILSKTTSSPDESLASNLQCDTVLLNSVSTTSRDTESEDIRPQTKKLCRDERAVDVIGPVDKGDRIIAKKGAKRVGSGKFSMSIHWGVNVESSVKPTCHTPSTSVIVRLSSSKPAMRSASRLPRPDACELNVGLDRRRPRFLASAESLAFSVWVDEAHREFLRIAEVTANISECKTCFWDTVPSAVAKPVIGSMSLLGKPCSQICL